MSQSQVRRFTDRIIAAATAKGLQPSLVAGLIDQESGGNPNATSPQNYYPDGRIIGHAIGLMQVLEGYFPAGVNGYDPDTNLSYGTGILRDAFDRCGFNNNGIAAYFGAVDRHCNITGATDATGADGFQYVASVRAAQQQYLDFDAQPQPQPQPGPQPQPSPLCPDGTTFEPLRQLCLPNEIGYTEPQLEPIAIAFGLALLAGGGILAWRSLV